MNRIKINETKIGKYGRMRLVFIKENRKDLYTELLFSGSLENYLAEINEYVKKRLWDYIQEIAKAQGVTEEMKAHDQISWLGQMNNIRNIAEEMIFDELIYY